MKAKMDFRIDGRFKGLIQLAAELKDITPSAYVCHLIQQSEDKIVDDIAVQLTSKTVMRELFGADEEADMDVHTRLDIFIKAIGNGELSLADEDKEKIFAKIDHWRKRITEVFQKEQGNP